MTRRGWLVHAPGASSLRRLVADILVIASTPVWADAAAGVSLWLPDVPLQGEAISFKTDTWRSVDLGKPPQSLPADPAIVCDSLVAAFDSRGGRVSLYTRKNDRLHRRGTLQPSPSRSPLKYRAVPAGTDAGVAIEVRTATPTDPAKDNLEYTVRLNADGVIEFRPAAATAVAVTNAPMRYGIVPSLVGVDLVFDPARYPDRKELCIPSSMGMYVGLGSGEDCMVVATWEPADQTTTLGLNVAGDRRIIDRLSVETGGRSLYLACLDCPNIWHAEPLKEDYLERHTPIGWKRPFDARWIGWFFVESAEMHYPFYFQNFKHKIWGRYVRDWYEFPVWFDGDKTIIHFEKKFPPTGEMLIYFLEGYAGTTRTARTVLSPVEVMYKALGADRARKVLDIEGVTNRFLQRDGHAVCAMSDQIGRIFARDHEGKERSEVERLLNDIVTFIRLVRERGMEFDSFARQTKAFLDDRTKTDSDLAEGFRRVAEMLDEIPNKVKNTMPSTSLDEIRAWTDEAKGLIDKPDKGKKERLVVLGHQWRSVAGTQDDLARDLSIVTIGIMEAAAEAGVASPKRVRVAEQILARCRQILRHGTTWEPRRVDSPTPTPG